MSSVEKKEAMINGSFGVVAGLVMGGPVGALMAGAVSAGLIHLEEKHDEELRRRERERRNPDPFKLEAERQEREARLRESLNKSREIYAMIKTKDFISVCGLVELENDYIKNYNTKGLKSVVPGARPYVKVKIFDKVYGHYYEEPVCESNGIVYNTDGFYRKLSFDLNNPNIHTYNLGWYRFDNPNKGRCLAQYMYTVDDGKTFHIYMDV